MTEPGGLKRGVIQTERTGVIRVKRRDTFFVSGTIEAYGEGGNGGKLRKGGAGLLGFGLENAL